MNLWNKSLIRSLCLMLICSYFVNVASAQRASQNLRDVPRLEMEGDDEIDFSGLEQQALGGSEPRVYDLEYQGNTFFEEKITDSAKEKISENDSQTVLRDPYTGKLLTPQEFSKFVDIEAAADSSWTLNDKHKIDTDHVWFKGQNFALTEWDKINTTSWLDLSTWKANRKFRDENPNWSLKVRETQLIEKFGKFLSCVGTCKVFRGKDYFKAQYMSRLFEGDEIVTEANSYAWIVLIDGSVVRISPSSSLSLNEVNISNNKFFHYVRLNKGHLYWRARQRGKYKLDKLTETDQLFLPLKLKEVNLENFERIAYQKLSKEERVLEMIDPLSAKDKQVFALNKLNKENNQFGKKDSELLMVFPNGTINVENPVVDIFVEPGSSTFIRNRNIEDEYTDLEESAQASFLFFRGYNNRRSVKLDKDQWYLVAAEGRDFEAVDIEEKEILEMQFLTKRIPTILLAAETWLKKDAKTLLSNRNNYDEFAFETGHRLWDFVGEGEKASKQFEINSRKSFLVEYTRRVETTNLRSLFKYLDKMDEQGNLALTGFTKDYYHLAFQGYMKAIENNFSSQKDIVKEYGSLQYYIWNLVNSKGR